MFKHLKKMFGVITSFLWSVFIGGLLTILPIVLTIAIFHLTLRLLANWLEPIKRWHPRLFEKVPQLHKAIIFLSEKIPYFEIIIAFILVFTIGIIVRIFILRSLIATFERLVMRVPIIRPVYSGIKQLTSALDPQNEMIFQKVVLFEFPRVGAYSIGFLTGEVPACLAPNTKEKFYGVYVPTTPNPTSGFYIILPEKDITITDLTRQEATTIIISGGIIQPERFAKK